MDSMQLNCAAPLLYGWMFEDINVCIHDEIGSGA